MSPLIQPGHVRNLSPLRLQALAQYVEAEGPDAALIADNLIAAAQRNGKGHRIPASVTLAQAILTVQPQSNLQGSDKLVVTLLDPEWELLDSGFFDANTNGLLDRIDLIYPPSDYPTLDPGHEFHWTLNQIEVQGNHTIALTFVNRYVYELQQHKGPLKANRSRMTRAQFLKMLAKRVGLEFYSYELNIKQPIATSAKAKAKNVTRKATKGQGLTAPISYTFWDGGHVTLTPGQIVNAQMVCDTIASHSAPDLAAWACLCACIVEPPNFSNPLHGDGSSVGILQVTAPTAADHNISALDIGQCVSYFLTNGFAKDANNIGAIGLANKSPNMLPGDIAQACQGSKHPDRYQAVLAGAKKIWEDYGGLSGIGSRVTNAYYFTVGTPSNPHETYYDAMVRLAKEVNWALVFDGNRLYYDSEPALAKQAPAAVLERGEVGLIDWHFDVDNRNIASQFTATLQCDPFDFNAGEVFEMRGFGPASTVSVNGVKRPGSWLIDTIDRNRHEIMGTFTLKQPSAPKAEPAPTSRTLTGSSANSGSAFVDAAYSEAQTISAQQLPYVWGGGHGQNGVPDIGVKGGNGYDGVTKGYDCSGSVSACLGAAGGLSSPEGSTALMSWGQAGPGKYMTVWANSDHVFIEFSFGSIHQGFNTVHSGQPRVGPLLGDWGGFGKSLAESGNFTPRHWSGT